MRGMALMLAALAAAFAQAPESLFQSKCASCHRSGNSVGAPPPENLRQMSWKAILAALETGKMTPIGAALSPAERESIAKYLGTSGTQALGASSHCPDSTPGKRRPAAAPGWNGWADLANTRFQNAKAAGLTRDNVPKLKLKWAFGFPGVTTAFGSPAIFDGKLFVGAADGSVYSLDAKSGCVHWVYTAAAGVRTSPSISDDGRLVYFGDLRGNVYALDAAAGSLIWKARADEHPMAVITGSPKLYAGRLYRAARLADIPGPRHAETDWAERQRREDLGTFRRGRLVVSDAGYREENRIRRHRSQLFESGHQHQRRRSGAGHGVGPDPVEQAIYRGRRLDVRLHRG